MFSGIFAKVLGGALVLSLLVNGGLYLKDWWNKSKIEKLEGEVASANAALELAERARDAAKDYYQKMAKPIKEKKKVDTNKIIDLEKRNDDRGMDDLFRANRMFKGPQDGNPAGGQAGNPGNLPARAP